MAAAASRQRAHLLREMSKTRPSSSSSRHSQSPQSTITSFDPDNDAEVSTRQIENLAQRLPELRASAQKYRKPMPAKFEPEYHIDTSAIGRAFPDFSQGGVSDNSNLSIEIGRGAKKGTDGSTNEDEQPKETYESEDFRFDESLSFADVSVSSNVFIDGPGFRIPSRLDDKTAIDKNSRQISDVQKLLALRNQVEPSPPTKAKDHGSAGSRHSSDGSRRTLTAMHARVRDENDMSVISDQRPPSGELTVRKTRFGNGKPTPNVFSNGLPTNFNASQGLQPPTPAGRPLIAKAKTPPATQKSVLADAPNVSELISGVFEDGTPVFSRHGKPRAFQHDFVEGNGGTERHANVDDVPVPFDEQAIFLSLRLLEDKVAVLERSKAEAEVAVKDLQEQNLRLQFEQSGRRRASHRSDSALGTTDSEGGDEMTGGRQRKVVIERNRLESSVRVLQGQLDASTRKASTAERILETITQERDSAVSQLSLAYVTTEHLKVENESLKAENSQLKDRINELTVDRDNETQQWRVRETTLQKDLESKVQAIRALEDGKKATASRTQSGITSSMRSQSQPQPNVTASAKTHQLDDDDDDDSLFDLTPRQSKMTVATPKESDSYPPVNNRANSGKSGHERSMQAGKGKSVGEEAPKNHEVDCQTGNASQDTTFLSFFDTSEVAKLRKTIEEERVAQKQRIAARSNNVTNLSTTMQEPQAQNLTQNINASFLPESSIKNLTQRSIRSSQESQIVDAGNENESNRRRSEPSTIRTRSHRRRRNTENMTSAFILPDITIRAPAASAQDMPELTKENKKVLSDLAQHGTKSCTVCKRAVRLDEHHDHAKSAKNTVMIPKPVPASDRFPEYAPGEEDHTLRPSQSPGIALATVLKGLEDETAHLKIKLSKYQALYNGHDPSLSKRQRKSIYQKIEGLLQAIDVKSDHIYALYDVLEGQKQQGQDLTEQEVEITLQSIGMDISDLDLEDAEAQRVDSTTEKALKPLRPTSSFNEVNEANEAWEGIESTVETTTSRFPQASQRRSPAA